MDKNYCIRRIQNVIAELNRMENNLIFSMVETDYSVEICCSSRINRSHRFGAYECMVFFSDYVCPDKAYETVREFVDIIRVASKLNDPTAFHNLAA